jgi:signal transduction histidine kinase
MEHPKTVRRNNRMKKLHLISVVVALLFLATAAVAEEPATKDECVVRCHEAAALINAKGLEEAIAVLSDPKGPFVWKDSYVFLMNLDGKMLAHPIQPELTKQEHLLLMTDPKDNPLFVHFVNLARKVGHGWVEYMWPKPGKTTPAKKITYIYRVPGQDVFVGAGVYVGGMMY